MHDLLKGIRVLDFTKVLAGPLCTQYLGDLGADIIKVEPTEKGDDTRAWPPFAGGEGTVFLSANRNKRSLAVDLKTAEGQALIHQLVPTCDVVIESYTTGVTQRLGIDYATLRQHRPDLVYCSISGFGRTGPMQDARGYDLILQAFSGAMAMTGEPGGNHLRIPLSPIDQATGMNAMSGILAALVARGRTGQGACIEVSLLESAVGLLGFNIQRYWQTQQLPEKAGTGHESLCPYRVFRAKDADLLVGVANDKLWQRFCRATGREELADDPRFRTNAERVRHKPETDRLVAEIIATRTGAEWAVLLEACGVPFSPVNTMADVLAHPQVEALGLVLDYEHPQAGAVKAIGHAMQVDGKRAGIERPAPLLGQHTEEILRELGIPEERIAELQRQHRIVQHGANA